MKRCMCILVALATTCLAGDIGRGYDIQWNNWMRICGTQPDTAKLFLDAANSLPPNDSTGVPVLGSVSRAFNSDSSKAWLWIVEQVADVKRNEPKLHPKQYSSYAIRAVLVFDKSAEGQKK